MNPGNGLALASKCGKPLASPSTLTKRRGLALAGTALRSGGDDGNEPAAILELRKQGFRHLGHAAVEENHVEGAGVWGAARVVAVDAPPHCSTQRLKGLARRGGKLWLGFDRGHDPREMGKDGGRVAGGAANIEHRVFRLDRSKLDKPREHDGRQEIARRTAVERRPDLERGVAISEIALGRWHETLARQRGERRQDAPVGHPVGAELRCRPWSPAPLRNRSLLPPRSQETLNHKRARPTAKPY